MSGIPAGSVPATGAAALGLRVRRVEGAPVVAVRVWLDGGARVERLAGLAAVAGRALSEGTRSRDWKRIADDAEALGMMLGSYGTFETHGVAVDALAADWRLALDWAAELVLEPSFPEDRCRWLARQAAGELDSLADQPEVKTAWAFLDQLYHPHRRALPLQGRRDDLEALTAADCAAFHLPALGRRRIVAVAGDVDESEVAARAEALFGAGGGTGADGPAAGEPPAVPAPVGRPETYVEVALPPGDPEDDDAGDTGGGEGEPAAQAHLYVGHLTVPRHHPDYEALELAAVVLGSGAGLTGRIPERIRDREGLAYTAYAQTVAGAGLDPGRLVAYVGTSAATVDRAARGVREEIERLVEGGVTDRELADARAYLLGREPFERETARQWAELMAEAEHYGLPLDGPGSRAERLATLDRAEVEAALRRNLRPDDLKVAVGVPSGIERIAE
jgi:zinc protease